MVNKTRQDKLVVNGLSNIPGDVIVNEFLVNGICTVEGLVDAKNVNINGMLNVKKNLTCKKMFVNGTVTIKDFLKTEDVEILGMITINKVTAKNFYCKGSINASSIHVKKLELEMDGNSNITFLESKNVQIKLKLGKVGIFTSDKLFSEKCYLEHVDIKFLKSKEVELGPNCKIGTLQAKCIKKDESSIIGKEKPWK